MKFPNAKINIHINPNQTHFGNKKAFPIDSGEMLQVIICFSGTDSRRVLAAY